MSRPHRPRNADKTTMLFAMPEPGDALQQLLGLTWDQIEQHVTALDADRSHDDVSRLLRML